jgi:hypothetical protein
MSGGQHQLEHGVAAAVPSPAALTDFSPAGELLAEPLPIPGLSTDETARRSGGGGADPLGGSAVDGETEAALRSPSGGKALDPTTRASMETAFGADFSSVRVHTDNKAATLSRSMQATAFTHGQNIFFSEGTYQPGSEGGSHLLAHELTHVVQRQQGRDSGGASASGTTIGKADDPLETEAEAVATNVVGALRRQTKNCGCGNH